MKFCLFVVLSLLVFSACKKKEIVKGCTNGSAVNYNPEAKHDDGSCHFQYYESDSIKGAYIPAFVNNNYNFSIPISFLIAVKNTYSITSNYGYIGEYYRGSAFAYSGGIFNTGECWFAEMAIKNSLSQVYDLTCNGVMWQNNSNSINFEDGHFQWLNGPTNIIENNYGFMNVGKINSGNVDISEGYNFEFDGVTNFLNSDSLIFAFHSPNKSLYFNKPINSPNSIAFSSNELSSLNYGVGYVEIIGLRYNLVVGNLKLHLNQTIRTKKVNFY